MKRNIISVVLKTAEPRGLPQFVDLTTLRIGCIFFFPPSSFSVNAKDLNTDNIAENYNND